MLTSQFDYHLPPERIAQSSVEPRDRAKLLVLDRKELTMDDRRVYDLPSLLRPGDLLVFNDSKVFKARLRATKGTANLEAFLLRPEGQDWLALIKPGKKVNPGDTLAFTDGTTARLIEKMDDGTARLDFGMSAERVFALADRIGEVPTPPYVKQSASAEQYQTVYAKTTGSVAAPTAGFHFTRELLAALEAKGIDRAFVTLHVGLGTFRPMKTKTIEAHDMHEEWAHVPEETVRAIEETKQRGGRVIVVGTTAMRALESAAAGGTIRPFSGFTRLFVTPGYQFHVADGLVTNFHLPKSTLLVLVSAFAGREFVLEAYRHAIAHDYRFYSFGDAMLIL